MAEARPGEEPADLTAVEHRMWEAYRTGSVCDLSVRTADRDDPHAEHVWGAERSVRAQVVALLLLHGPSPVPGRVASLKLRGVRITGRLDLSGGTVSPYVELQSCRFDSEIQLSETRFGTLRLINCAIPRLEAARLHTEGDLHMPRCRVARGIRLTDAQIGTDLLISQAVVQRDTKGRAITADGMSVAQDFQGELLETYGEVSLRGATVGVSMNMRGARLRNPYGRYALNAPQLTVERTLYLTSIALDYVPGSNSSTPPYGLGLTPTRGQRAQRFECRGGMRLDDGRFGDAIDFYGARFVLTEEQEISLRRIQTPEFRFVGERPERGRVVVSGAKVVKLVDTSTSWPGPGGVSIEGFVYENLAPGVISPSPADWSGWRRRPPSTRRSRTSGSPPCCGPAVRTRTPARCCWPSSGGAGAPCRLRPRPGGTSRTGRWSTATARAGPRCGWRSCGRRARCCSPSTGRPHQGERAPRVGCRPVRPGPAAPGDRPRPGGPVEGGRRLAVGGGGAGPSGVDPGHDGGGGGLPAAEAGVTAPARRPLPCAS